MLAAAFAVIETTFRIGWWAIPILLVSVPAERIWRRRQRRRNG